MYSSFILIKLSVDTVKLLPQASDDYNPYLITVLQYLMSMGIYNLPRGKNQNCARLHFIETYNVQTENTNANTAAAVKPTRTKKKQKKGKKINSEACEIYPLLKLFKTSSTILSFVNTLLS